MGYQTVQESRVKHPFQELGLESWILQGLKENVQQLTESLIHQAAKEVKAR